MSKAFSPANVVRFNHPYCVHQLPGGNRFIYLNRLYKPLDIREHTWVDYEDYPWSIRSFDFDLIEKHKSLFTFISERDKDGLRSGFFYSDTMLPERITWKWVEKYYSKFMPIFRDFGY